MAEGIIEAKQAATDDFRQTVDEVETQVKVLLRHKEEQTRMSFHVVTMVKLTVQDNVQHLISRVMCVKSLTILRECVGRVQEISGILRHIGLAVLATVQVIVYVLNLILLIMKVCTMNLLLLMLMP